MATIPENKTSARSNLGEPPPKGIHIAVCIDVVDEYNVTRKKWQSEETELVNLTWFIFGVKCKDGSFRKVQTNNIGMKISNDERSTLRKVLTSWMGEAPKPGFDTKSLVGKPAQLTLVESVKGDKTYIDIQTVSEVMEELLAKVPKVSDFGDYDNNGADIPF